MERLSRWGGLLACLLWTADASAADLLVPAQFAGIQPAIAAAADGDRVLVGPGTYVERIDFLGKAIVVESSGGPAVTRIDAAGAGSVVSFVHDEGPDSILRGFTISGGQAQSSGGGLRILRASPLIECCIIRGNHAPLGGGGIYIGDHPQQPSGSGQPTIRYCVIESNTTGGSGAGIRNDRKRLALRDCLIRTNTAAVSGGGLDQFPFVQEMIIGCIFEGNVAGLDGGGANSRGESQFAGAFYLECTFLDNEAGRNGGAVHAGTGTDSFDPVFVTLERVVARGNSADSGSAVALTGSGGEIQLRGCVISGNQAGIGGAAVLCANSGSTTIDTGTVADNGALSSGSAIHAAAGFVRIRTSILWANQGSAISGTPAPNQVYDCVIEGGYSGGINILDDDPLFWDASVADYDLRPGSPAEPWGALPVETEPWSTLDGSLPGVQGFPDLAGSGSLSADTLVTVALAGAAPRAPALLVLGSSAVSLPAAGGLLVPAPDLVLALQTDGVGGLECTGRFPAGVPAGFTFFLQAWVQDPCTPFGHSASNGLRGLAP